MSRHETFPVVARPVEVQQTIDWLRSDALDWSPSGWDIPAGELPRTTVYIDYKTGSMVAPDNVVGTVPVKRICAMHKLWLLVGAPTKHEYDLVSQGLLADQPDLAAVCVKLGALPVPTVHDAFGGLWKANDGPNGREAAAAWLEARFP